MRHLGLAFITLLAVSSPAAADTTPQALPFTQGWNSTELITADDNWSGVPGIVGYQGVDSTTTLGGLNPTVWLTPADPVAEVDVIANQTAVSSTGGVAEFHQGGNFPATMVALQGSGTADYPQIVLHLDTTGTAFVRVAYDLYDLDFNSDNAVQPVVLQYRVGNSGDFTNVFTTADASDGPSLGGRVTNVSAVLPAAAGNVALLEVRIMTGNATGSDEWIGIDNISVTDANTPPSAVGMASPATQIRGGAVSVTAAVTPGAFPTSTGLAVTCNLTSIGGSATQALFDDGTNGDGMGGDNMWTFATTVGTGAAFGATTFACSVSDAETRSSNFTINFTVIAQCGDGAIAGAETCDDGGSAAGDGCSATCTIEAGWQCTGAPSVCSDIDECATNTDNCDANAACTNTVGSFTCACNTGYMGNGVTCTDIDECAMNTDTCASNAVCTNMAGTFACSCPTGYTGDGQAGGTGCTDVDECTAMTDDCVTDAACANSPGAFTCTCPVGFMGDGKTGGTGCTDLDECTTNTDNCDANAMCTNTVGSFTCACNTGFAGNGVTCTDNDECAAGTDNCATNATCTNTPGSFTCACSPGYSGDGVNCAPNCGDGLIALPEECDDSDMTAGDGCTPNCAIEDGWSCTGTPSTCTAVCGDGLKVSGEACDDTNTDPDDGCSDTCQIEEGWTCTGTPSTCEPPDDGGCCSSSTDPRGVAALLLLVIVGLRRRQRAV